MQLFSIEIRKSCAFYRFVICYSQKNTEGAFKLLQVRVKLGANAGVSIRVGGKNIWVDALFEGVGNTFSHLRPKLRDQILSGAFGKPDYIVYTHCHGDHYSRNLTKVAMEKWPDAKVLLPEQELDGQILLTGGECTLTDGALRLRFMKLPHAGEIYADVKLYGLLISTDGCNILLPGDCEVASPALKTAVGDRKIDLAIVDFPWITKRAGKEFLEEQIAPAHLIGYHLPFEEDDGNLFRLSAAKAAQKMGESTDVRLLWNPLQEEEINI